MQQEIEAKFLNVPHNDIRLKLEQLGAVQRYPQRVMRRRNFDFPDKRLDSKKAWVRLRDEGDKIELMLKQSVGSAIGDIRETPVIVSDFEAATAFLLSIGLYEKSEQETKRELWQLGDVEIMLDEWPWVKPFIEIEAQSEEGVREVAGKLGLDWTEAIFDTIEPVYYAEYDVTRDQIHAITSISFRQPVPTVFETRRK
jgi:adenylate cyclase, class 2